jgi:hypothetical protein
MKVAGLSQIWEVYELMFDVAGTKHYRLQDIRERTRTITISEWALINPRFYRPIHRENNPHRRSVIVGIDP